MFFGHNLWLKIIFLLKKLFIRRIKLMLYYRIIIETAMGQNVNAQRENESKYVVAVNK